MTERGYTVNKQGQIIGKAIRLGSHSLEEFQTIENKKIYNSNYNDIFPMFMEMGRTQMKLKTKFIDNWDEEKKIQFVMNKTNCTEKKARKNLRNNNGNITNTLMLM